MVPLKCTSGVSFCYLGQDLGFFLVARRYFLRCRQVSKSLSLLFSMLLWSSVKMTSFSVKQRSQARLPLENACPLAFIDHFISLFTSNGIPLFFSFQMYEESVVWFASGLLNDVLCTEYRALNFSVDPKYFMTLLSA